MKRFIALIILASFSSSYGEGQTIQTTLPVQQQQQQPQQPAKEDTGSVVLHHFGNIVGHFFSIVKDPKNATNVGQNVTGILSNIVTIAAQAFKSGELSLDATPEEIMVYAQEQSDLLRSSIMCMTRGKMMSMHMTK